jgi:glycosyltransferase 2 family protein
MKLALNIGLSLAMLGLCIWLVWPSHGTRIELEHALSVLSWSTLGPALAMYLGLMIVSQVTRSLRWNFLLAPLGVRMQAGPMLAVQSVGFMAILALPARLGELVRPGLMRKQGMSASVALGVVAVERIIDGLLVSLFVFGAFFAIHSDHSPGWMMPTAFAALGVFSVALIGLVFAMKWPEQTVRFGLKMTLLPRIAPRIAGAIERKALQMISGFSALRDPRNLALFAIWSLVYWVANGLSFYVLGRAFGLDLSFVGSFAVMGLVAVGVMLPNSPGLVGQYQWFMLLGLSLYLGPAAAIEGSPVYVTAFAFANAQYVLQVGWYFLCGALGLATRYVSFHDVWDARRGTSATTATVPDVTATSHDVAA